MYRSGLIEETIYQILVSGVIVLILRIQKLCLWGLIVGMMEHG